MAKQTPTTFQKVNLYFTTKKDSDFLRTYLIGNILKDDVCNYYCLLMTSVTKNIKLLAK